jgi:hypothetical protein
VLFRSPKNADPNGLAKNATENVASDWSISVDWVDAAKKREGNTSTAAFA